MKKLLSAFILIIGFVATSFSQCEEENQTKVLLVGDSWAFFMGVDGTIDKVLNDWGHSGYKFLTNLTLAQNGAKTHHFTQPDKQAEIEHRLLNDLNIKFVHLSLAGNDLLGNWKSQSFTEYQSDSLMASVNDSLHAVVDFIKSVREDIIIVLGGYAYPNFDEVISGQLVPSLHPFYSNWEKMEFPTNLQINQKLNEFTDIVADYYADDPRVMLFPATGITQYTYGQESPLGVAPFGTYPPETVPLPYGDVTYPSPKSSLRDYGVTKDCFHLSKKGYEDLIGYTVQKYYHKAMMDDKYFLAEDVNTNGSVASDGSTSSSLYLGEADGVEYKTILTFETLYNLEYVVEKGSLFLHRVGEEGGGNPVNEQVIIEINDGAFGTSATLEPADYSEVGKAEGNPCVHGRNRLGRWVRLDLPEELLEFITVNDVTQFKLSSPSHEGTRVEFSGVSDPEFSPVLNIVYGDEEVTTIAEEELDFSVKLYPNPVRDKIYVDVDFATITAISLRSVDGKEITKTTKNSLDVSHLPAGVCFVEIQTNKGVKTQKLIKQ